MEILILVLILVAALIGGFWLMRWRMNRATKQVIDAFIQNGAIGPDKGKTLEELGLGRKGITLLRDYRGTALQGLMNAGAVMQAEDGKLYLTKEGYERYLAMTGGLPYQEPPRFS